MGRLIDEAVLLDKHAEQCGEKSCDTCRFVKKEKCASYVAIVETPTAYDVEAVLEQIEEYIHACEDCECPSANLINCEDHPCCSSCRYEWLRMIVRKGGVK